MRTGAPWRDLPKSLVHGNQSIQDFQDGATGIFDQIFEVVQDSLELDDLSLDSSTVKVHKHGSGAQKKGKSGNRKSVGAYNKIHLITDASGNPTQQN